MTKSITEIHPTLPSARSDRPWPKKRIVCADGFSMSVQANEFAYCTPRTDEGPHTHFEIGFPSQVEPLLMKWAESPDDPTGSVYAYVPAAVIDAVIAKHGGIVEPKTSGVPQIKIGRLQ